MLVRVKIQTVSQSFPAGTKGGDWRYCIYDAENKLVEDKRTQAPSEDFDLPVGENYRVDVARLAVARLDDGSVRLGPIKSAKFDIVDTTHVQIAVADGVTVTQLT